MQAVAVGLKLSVMVCSVVWYRDIAIWRWESVWGTERDEFRSMVVGLA